MDYLPHARRILQRQTTMEDVRANLLSKAGRSFYILGQYCEAETMHQRALEGREKVMGPDHPATLASVNDLGFTLAKGQHQEAEALARRAVERLERVLWAKSCGDPQQRQQLGQRLWKSRALRRGRRDTVFRRAAVKTGEGVEAKSFIHFDLRRKPCSGPRKTGKVRRG